MPEPPTTRHQQDYASRPCYGELIAIIAAGIIHVAFEFTSVPQAARLFNVVAVIGFLVYILWCGRRTSDVLTTWGMRMSTFWPALRLQLLFGIPALVLLSAWGAYFQRFPPPPTFLLAAALYPLWGIAQQFALQNLLARNLRAIVRNSVCRAAVAASLFSMAHIPLVPIVLLTLIAGFFITWIYEKRPNLWAAGLLHGVLGAMAFYFVLGRDPGARVLQLISY